MSLNFSKIHQHIDTSQRGTSLKIPSGRIWVSWICNIHSHPYAIFIIVELATLELLLQQPKQPVVRHDPQCDNATMDTELLQLFHWEVLGHPPYCLC
jgi:hypothetical protein